MGYVMVVDDDELLADMLCDMLASSGHRAVHYRSAAHLRERMIIRKPDAILLDNLMTGSTGMDALAEIKADPRLAAIPVIMMTAQRGQECLLAALRAGASDYMTKPFLPAEMMARVDGILASGTMGRQAA